MPFAWAAGIAAVGGIASSIIGSNSAEDAAKTQAKAANNASQVQLDMFNQTQANEKPYMTAGSNALTQLQNGLGIGGGNTTGTGSLNAPFTAQQFQASPGYNWQLQQGEDAVLNSASAHGGALGGNTLKALTQYGQGLANQDYWNAYNAYTSGQNQRFGQLQTLAGSGQNAAANLGSLGNQVAGQVGQNIIGAGNANSAAQITNGNILGSGINNFSSLAQQYLLANNGGGLQPVDFAGI